MPTIPIYVRKDDYDKFLRLYSPEWLHEALNAGPDSWEGPDSMRMYKPSAPPKGYDKPPKNRSGTPVPMPDIHRVPSRDEKPWKGPITKAQSAGRKK